MSTVAYHENAHSLTYSLFTITYSLPQFPAHPPQKKIKKISFPPLRASAEYGIMLVHGQRRLASGGLNPSLCTCFARGFSQIRKPPGGGE